MFPMKPRRFGPGLICSFFLILPFLVACGAFGPSPKSTSTLPPAAATTAPAPTPSVAPITAPPTAGSTPVAPTPAPTLAATPTAAATPAASALMDVVNQYTQAWHDGKYSDMYNLLSVSAKTAITETKFVDRYTNITSGIDQVSVSVLATPPANSTPTGTPPTVLVPIHVTYSLAVLGNIEEDNQIPMVQENGAWKVDWTAGLIFKDLTATRTVNYEAVPAHRGAILDRNGNVLAQDGNVLAVGVVPGEIKNEADLLKALGDYLQMPAADIKKLYAGAQPNWFIPIKDLPESQKQDAQTKLGSVLGVSLRDQPERVYPYGPAAADFVGYVSAVQPAEVKNLQSKGYEVGDMFGRSGIEAWADQYLNGQKGATLSIIESDGTLVRTVAQKLTKPGDDIQTTVDINYQIEANKVLGTHSGSLIVMNPQDNSILAIASEPTFDPNLFVLGMSDAQWQALNAPSRPLLYRPAQGLYPTGSIFKVITMSAGLEKGGFKPSDTFDCGLNWNGLPGVTLHNWEAEGTLNLIQGLTGSCDPTFYTIGLKLNQLDPNILPTFARAYGLGQATGTSGIDDAAGTVPDPAWKEKVVGQPWYDGDGVNLAIGQGFLLATPLQMANVYSTIANHGTVRNPILISQIKGSDGSVVKSFSAQARGTVPISQQNLGYITQGMRGVTSTPLGTAYYAWKGSTIPMEAKTGSAENETSKAHAWFVGYTSPDHPTLLALVMLEGGELGGEFAAPLGRQIVEYALAHPVKA